MEEELRDIVADLASLKNHKKELEDEIKGVNACIEEAEDKIVIGLLNAGTDKQSFPGIGTVSISPRDYPRIVDKDTFFNFLRENDYDGIITEQVNSKTLASWFKDQELSKDEYEAIGLENYQKTRINLRRS